MTESLMHCLQYSTEDSGFRKLTLNIKLAMAVLTLPPLPPRTPGLALTPCFVDCALGSV